MKHKTISLIMMLPYLAFLGTLSMILMESCKISEKVASKTGAQLWAENCQRCHNTPPPNAFSADQWETIGLHMQSRALLTDTEKNNIVKFLKQY